MDQIRTFLKEQGLNNKEVEVYLACLRQGDGTVLQISRQAQVKRSTTYLILEELVRRGLVNAKKDRKSIHYFPAHPKKIVTDLRNRMEHAERLMPELLGLYKDKSEKPTIAVYEDMVGYEHTGSLLRDAVVSGEEALVYGNISFFFKTAPTSADEWFKLMRNKRYKTKLLMYGWGEMEMEYVKRSHATLNPGLQLRVVKRPVFPVHSEQAIFADTVVLFTGGNKFFSAVIRSQALADTFRTTFMQLWEQAEEIPEGI